MPVGDIRGISTEKPGHSGQKENDLSGVLWYRRGDSGLALALAIPRHEKDLDFIVRPCGWRLQRAAPGVLLFHCGHAEMASLVPAFRLDWDEFNHYLPHKEFHWRV